MTQTSRPRHGPLTRTLVISSLVLAVLLWLGMGECRVFRKKTPTPPPTRATAQAPRPTFTSVPTVTPVPRATQTPLPPAATPIPSTSTPAPLPTSHSDKSPLTGLPVGDPTLLRRRALAVRIGNDPIIRPQEGLGLADIVYEEIMDGWTLTRFTAIYLAGNVQRLRPIRSARLTSLSIPPQYDAALVHSGASDRIRLLLSQASFVDLDEFFHPEPYGILGGYDWRGRMYTSTEDVRRYLREKGWESDRLTDGYTFDNAPPVGEPAQSIGIAYPELCAVDWRYHAASGSYRRSVQGQPHTEALTGEQIAAENVIVLYAEHRKTDIVEDSLGSTAIDIVLKGSGRARVCRDGVVVEGIWRELSPNRPIQYYDTQGRLIPLKPGQTWIQLVPKDYGVVIG